jgi:dTMP kinase
MPGFFITLEGTEGCGKSTLMGHLADRLESDGHDVVQLREPGGTESGEEIRKILKHGPDNLTPEAELLLMNASRAQLVREVIRPALDEGKVILCDRFYDSTTAYQGYGRGLDLNLVQSVIDLAVGGTIPNLTLLLEIPLDISEERQSKRSGTDRFESGDRAFFERVALGYQTIAKAHSDRISTIDATLPIESVTDLCLKIINQRMKKCR